MKYPNLWQFFCGYCSQNSGGKLKYYEVPWHLVDEDSLKIAETELLLLKKYGFNPENLGAGAESGYYIYLDQEGEGDTRYPIMAYELIDEVLM